MDQKYSNLLTLYPHKNGVEEESVSLAKTTLKYELIPGYHTISEAASDLPKQWEANEWECALNSLPENLEVLPYESQPGYLYDIDAQIDAYGWYCLDVILGDDKCNITNPRGLEIVLDSWVRILARRYYDRELVAIPNSSDNLFNIIIEQQRLFSKISGPIDATRETFELTTERNLGIWLSCFYIRNVKRQLPEGLAVDFDALFDGFIPDMMRHELISNGGAITDAGFTTLSNFLHTINSEIYSGRLRWQGSDNAEQIKTYEERVSSLLEMLASNHMVSVDKSYENTIMRILRWQTENTLQRIKSQLGQK